MVRHESLDAKPFHVDPLVRNEKLGRNDRCWCKSGLKYKFCHLNRDKQKLLNPLEQSSLSKKRHRKGKCQFPTGTHAPCGANAIASHTIQRGGGLSSIAENGHVLTLKFDLADMVKTDGNPQPQKIGLKSASTFPLFCSRHDDQAFKKIEGSTLTIDQESAFLFNYRAITFENFLKEKSLDDIQEMRSLDKGHQAWKQDLLQESLNVFRAGTELGARDLITAKREYDQKLLNKDYRDIHYAAITFDRVLPVVVSGAFLIEYDFNGAELQRLFTQASSFDQLSMTITTYNNQSICIFCWYGAAESQSRTFVETFLSIPDDEKAGRLVDACFVFSENTFLRPSWWLNLASIERARLLGLFKSGTAERGRSASDLLVGHRFVDVPSVQKIERSW